MISLREQFVPILCTGPLLPADAIVCLTGEDAEPRLTYAVALMRQRHAGFLMLSGGVDSDYQMSAETLCPKLLGMGLSPDRIILEKESTNTREQAVNVVAYAQERGWQRLIVVASAYHSARGYLTFLRAAQEVGQHENIHILTVPVSHSPWFGKPAGMSRTRQELFIGEMGKIALYQDKGHVATYAEGMAALRFWEGK